MSISSSSSEDLDQYENDDFVVPDNEVEEEEVKPRRIKLPRRRRRRLRQNHDEDLELVQENLGLRKKPNLSPELEEASSDGSSIEAGEILEDLEGNSRNLAAEIFGGEGVPLPDRPTAALFDPADCKENFLTEEDQLIKDLDVPERLQAAFLNRELPQHQEIQAEAEWLTQRFQGYKPTADAEFVKEAIQRFLFFFRLEKYEVQYISRYLLHELKPGLESSADLLMLATWDRDWGQVYTLKSVFLHRLSVACKNRQQLEAAGILSEGDKVLAVTELPPAVQNLISSTALTDFLYELSDLEAYTSAFVYTHASKLTKKTYHPLQLARVHHLEQFFAGATLTPEQLAENLKSKAVVHPCPVCTVRPQDRATTLLSTDFTEEIHVIKAAKTLQKTELAASPEFRQAVRQEYLAHILLRTSPTVKGRTSLDVFHPFYRVKNLACGKPLSTWDASYIAEAFYCDQMKLIQLVLEFPWREDRDDKIFKVLKTYYLTTEDASESETGWNMYRKEVLKEALHQLYNEFAKDVRAQLLTRAEEWVTLRLQRKFFKLLSKPGFTTEDGATTVVCSSVVSNDSYLRDNVALCILNTTGEVLHLQSFKTLATRTTDQESAAFAAEKREVTRLLAVHRPRLVVVGANCLQAVQLRRVLGGIVGALSSSSFNPSEIDLEIDFSHGFTEQVDVVMENTEVPMLFALSMKAKSLFPGLNHIEKACVSLGRYVQNPLAETLGLWTDPIECQIVRLTLDPLQNLVSEGKRLKALELVATDICASLGVKINELIDLPHLLPPLQFLPGLGPVKAHALLAGIRQRLGGRLTMRVQLLMKNILGERVYENAAAFLQLPYDEEAGDPLDSTRIHPKHYELAQVIAKSSVGDVNTEQYPHAAIERVMRKPQLMDELDIDAYASKLEGLGQKNMTEVLNFVVRELAAPFYNVCKAYTEPSPVQLLYLCSCETKRTLRKGSVAQAMILGYNSNAKYLRCRLESGLEGIVEASFFECKNEQLIEEKYPRGQVVTGRVIEVSARLQNQTDLLLKVKLSLLPDDVSNHGKFVRVSLDDAFIIDEADWVEKALMEDGVTTGQKYVPRVVNHPRFKNIGYTTACNELVYEDIGSYLFRPSSKGTDHITCTWKFYDNVLSHLDILEEGKPAENMLGTRFRIGNDVYDSLQEVADRYVAPCAALMKESIGHPKFLTTSTGDNDYVISSLEREKQTRPSIIPYKLSVSPKYPQYLILQYLPSEKVLTEYIKVKPKGLFFHEAYHPNLDFLVHWFKKHYGDRVYKNQLSRAREPMTDTRNHYAIPPKAPESTPDTHQRMPMPVAQAPVFADATPYVNTPRIGAEEWAGGRDLKSTPFADRWDLQRNFDTWTGKQAGELPEVPETSWGTEANFGDVGFGSDRKEPDKCFKCGESGHMSRECTSSKPSNACFKCGETGHKSRECTSSKPASCFKCGQPGHMSRDCASSTNVSTCYNCGEPGHMSRDCTQPKSERRPGRGRGGRGGRGRGRGGGDSDSGWTGSSNAGWGGQDSGTSGWGGQEAPSSGWGGQEAPSSGWGGQEAPSSSWGGQEAPSSSWGGQEAPSSSWGGQDTTANTSAGEWGGGAPSNTESNWGGNPPPSSSGGWGGEASPAPASSWGGQPSTGGFGEEPKPTASWGGESAPAGSWGGAPEVSAKAKESPPQPSASDWGNSSGGGWGNSSTSGGGWS